MKIELKTNFWDKAGPGDAKEIIDFQLYSIVAITGLLVFDFTTIAIVFCILIFLFTLLMTYTYNKWSEKNKTE